MHVFVKLLLRRKVFTFFLAGLLGLGVCFSCIGFSAWSSARAQYADIQNGYITIAIPKEQPLEVVDPTLSWGSEQQSRDPLDSLDEAQIPGLIQIDRRALLSAVVQGCEALSSGALDELKYDEAFDQYSVSYCVLALECLSIEDTSRPFEQHNAFSFSMGVLDYEAQFRILEPVVRVSGYDLPPYDDTIKLFGSGIFNPDGSIPFQVGETYLVRGFYIDFPIRQIVVDDDNGGWHLEWQRAVQADHSDIYQDAGGNEIEEDYSRYLMFTHVPELMGYSLDEIYTGEHPAGIPNFTLYHRLDEERMSTFSYAPEDSLPFFTQYEGNWRDFLQTEEGRVWADEIIPDAKRNASSATVILTDNIDSLYMFNTGEASILEGRSIFPSEYTSGERVCMVSAAYAYWNGLELGDRLTLDLYDPGYCQVNAGTHAIFGGNDRPTVCRRPIQADDSLGLCQDYAIVGIYTGPEFSYGIHSFNANTIFVPKTSVPNAELYEDTELPLLSSYILKNGTADAFEAYMHSLGLGGMFLYFDQNYAGTAGALAVLMQNAMRMALISALVFLLVAGLYLYLSLRRMGRAVRSMRLIGLSFGEVRAQMLWALLPLTWLSVLGGALLGALLFQRVTRIVLTELVTPDRKMIFLCVAVLALLLTALSVLFSDRFASKGLMQSGSRSGRKVRRPMQTVDSSQASASAEKMMVRSPLPGSQKEKTVAGHGGGSFWALCRVTLLAAWRRRGASALLAAMALVGVFSSMVLHTLTLRQQTALDDMMNSTPIHCVVTDPQGIDSGKLNMLSAFVDRLTGLRHEAGCYLDEYVTNVRALARMPLEIPINHTLIRVLSLDSDKQMSETGQAEVRFKEGYDETILRTREQVCLVYEGAETLIGTDGREYFRIQEQNRGAVELLVVGTVAGGPGETVYCPFYMQEEDGISSSFPVETCSFDIRDNHRLAEAKEAIFQEFVEPDLSNQSDGLHYGVLVQDEAYLKTVGEIEANISMLRLLLPVLLGLCYGIGLFTSSLATRGRVKEFAVMRCMGLKPRQVFALVLMEFVCLALLGAALGLAGGWLLEGTLSAVAAGKAALLIGIYLLGASITALRVSRVSVMELMKVEE